MSVRLGAIPRHSWTVHIGSQTVMNMPRRHNAKHLDRRLTAAIVRFMSGRWSASTRQPSASALHEPTGFYLAVDCLAPRRKGERSFAMGRPCTCGALAVVAGA
jgi:hypothetical protein